ncbi:hypothetical protein LCGC14_2288360, partial [marine sediment metagenome]
MKSNWVYPLFWILILLILLFISSLYAVDTKMTALAELTAVADADIIYIVDDPLGTPLPRKITVINLFDTINTFSKLNTIVPDKTLVNEEDAITWDSLGTFSAGITIATGQAFIVGTTTWTSSDEMDGTKIKDADYGEISISAGGAWSIDDGVAVTNWNLTTPTITTSLHIENFFAAPPDDLGDFDNYHLVILGEVNTGRHAGMLFSTDITTYGGSAIVHYDTGAGGVGDLVFYTKQSISAIPPVEVMRLDDAGDVTATGALEAATLTEGGNAVYNATETPGGELGGTFAAFTIDNNVAVTGWDLTTPTITSGATFVDADISPDKAGELVYDNTVAGIDDGAFAWYDDDEIKYVMDYPTLPTDGEDDYHLAYDKDTDKMYWKADADSGGSTAWDNIGNPTSDGSIAFGGYEQIITSTLDEANHVVFKIDHTDAEIVNGATIFQIQAVGNADPDLTYVKIVDASGGAPNTVFSVGADGAIANDGNITSGGTVEGATLTEGGNAVPNDTDHLGFFGGTTSAQLLAEMSDETGSGLIVFGTSPTFITGYTVIRSVDTA